MVILKNMLQRIPLQETRNCREILEKSLDFVNLIVLFIYLMVNMTAN